MLLLSKLLKWEKCNPALFSTGWEGRERQGSGHQRCPHLFEDLRSSKARGVSPGTIRDGRKTKGMMKTLGGRLPTQWGTGGSQSSSSSLFSARIQDPPSLGSLRKFFFHYSTPLRLNFKFNMLIHTANQNKDAFVLLQNDTFKWNFSS